MMRRAVLTLLLLQFGVMFAAVRAEDGERAGRTLLHAVLGRTDVAPQNAKGKAKFDRSSARTIFSIEGENLVRLNSQSALVRINGTTIGTLLIRNGRFRGELSTRRNQQIPEMGPGTVIEVEVGSVTILSGGLR